MSIVGEIVSWAFLVFDMVWSLLLPILLAVHAANMKVSEQLAFSAVLTRHYEWVISKVKKRAPDTAE